MIRRYFVSLVALLGLASITSSTGSQNAALGVDSLRYLTSGTDNTAIGVGSLTWGTTQTGNTAATGNVVIGPSVGSTTLASGSNNILIGTGDLLFWNKNSLAAPAVTACGSSPSIDTHANNKSGTVTVGTGAVASCTIILAGTGYTTWNHCRVTSQSSLAAFAYSYTKTVITVTATSLTSDLIDYDCDGY